MRNTNFIEDRTELDFVLDSGKALANRHILRCDLRHLQK